MEFSRPEYWSRDLSLIQRIFPTQISCIAGGFFTSWTTREAQEHWQWVFHSKKGVSWKQKPKNFEKNGNSTLSTFLSNSIFIVVSYVKISVLDNLNSIKGTINIWRIVKELIYLFHPWWKTWSAVLQSTAATSKNFIVRGQWPQGQGWPCS